MAVMDNETFKDFFSFSVQCMTMRRDTEIPDDTTTRRVLLAGIATQSQATPTLV